MWVIVVRGPRFSCARNEIELEISGRIFTKVDKILFILYLDRDSCAAHFYRVLGQSIKSDVVPKIHPQKKPQTLIVFRNRVFHTSAVKIFTSCF